MREKVLITGASMGIGREIARMMGMFGYDLYLTCFKNREPLEELKKKMEEVHCAECDIFVCDVGDYQQVKEMFGKIERLDILVNNAGISHMGLLGDTTVEEWQGVMNTNLNGVFYTCKEAVPLMVREKKGRIVNISSVWGEKGASMEVAYSASKGGVNGFTRALARELAPSNIQVNAVSLGAIDTRMNQYLSREEKEALCEEIPMGRLGTPGEAAHMVLQVIRSPEYFTGQVITMDGGWV